MVKSSPNYGIDMLRIIAMLGVVVLHVLGHGGILNSVTTPVDRSVAWFFEILAYPAVNCFVLISGYVGYRGEKYYPRLKNIISIFLTVLFYSVSICLIFKFFFLTPVNKIDLLNSFIPMTSKQYWFFSAYFGMFLLSPFLNMIVHRSSKKQTFIFLLFITLASCCSIHYNPFSLSGGYGLCWLILLYCLGAVMKKYDLPALLSAGKWAIMAFLSFMAIWLIKIYTFYMRESFLKMIFESVVSYVSPLMLLAAVGWVSSFSKISYKKINPKVMAFFSTSAFSVYLIHINPYPAKYLLPKLNDFVVRNNVGTFILSIICEALIIFLVCILIDKVRILLFKLVKADKFSEKAEKIVKNAVNKAYEKFDRLGS